MATVVRDKAMGVPLKSLFETIIDFESYPQFLPEVVSAKATGKGKKVRVDFELEVIKRFEYTLEFVISEPTEVKWSLMKSNFFKTNDGLWLLKEIPSGVEAHYELEVAFGFLVPGWVTKKMTEVSLPTMFDRFEKRAAGK
ncbi:MAG: hypothetical protein HYR96_03255 [Deltaproteobacteria bacterium]|nr:hypothetical protein [Deltaproteobacteria bacterium]MBI3294299.1 hypothetical protein [Deltaproteobacteria bacterium]